MSILISDNPDGTGQIGVRGATFRALNPTDRIERIMTKKLGTGYTLVRPGVARVQGLIPLELAQRLVDLAKREGKTISAVLHESIAARVQAAVLIERRPGRPPRRKYQTRLTTATA